MSYWNQIQLNDNYGWIVENSPMGEQRITEVNRLVGASFHNGTLDPNFWNSYTTGGTITQASGQCMVYSGTGTTTSAFLKSVRKARYTGGSCNRYRAQVVFNLTGTTNIRRFGCYDEQDGAFFELSGNTLYSVYRNNLVDTKVISSSWNSNTTIPTLTNVNTYEIYYTNKKIYYVVNDILMHTTTMTTLPWSKTKNFNCSAESINLSGTISYGINIWVSTICRLGPIETAPIYKYINTNTTTILKYGAGQLHQIIVTDNVGTIDIYDNTSGSGTLIASLDAAKILGNIDFHVPFSDGLTVVTATNAKCTIIYE
jgi:hypothetical protein